MGMNETCAVPAALEALEQHSLNQLNAEIRRCLMGFACGSGLARRAYFRRLCWVEAMREKLHGMPAPKRRFA